MATESKEQDYELPPPVIPDEPRYSLRSSAKIFVPRSGVGHGDGGLKNSPLRELTAERIHGAAALVVPEISQKPDEFQPEFEIDTRRKTPILTRQRAMKTGVESPAKGQQKIITLHK